MSDAPEIPKANPSLAPARLDPDRFSKLASGVQSIITAIGIVVGGVWVLVTFWELGTVEKSRADIAKLELEQRVSAEELAERQPILLIDIKWDTSGGTIGGKRYISLQAKLRNDGKHPVSFRDTYALISRLLQQSGQPDPGEKTLRMSASILNDDGSICTPRERVLRSGQSRTIAFLVPPLMPGNYLIQIKTIYGGMLITNGKLRPSADDNILAVEQSVVNVPDGVSESRSSPAIVAQPGTVPECPEEHDQPRYYCQPPCTGESVKDCAASCAT
jgi:hypothetical protein